MPSPAKKQPDISPEWLSPQSAGVYAEVGTNTVHEWLKTGKLIHSRINQKLIRIRRRNLDTFLEDYIVQDPNGDIVKDAVNDICSSFLRKKAC